MVAIVTCMKQKDLPGVVSNQQLVTQEFLSPVVFPEASLTPENLSTVLDIMSDGLWRRFGGYANIPDSEMDRIKAQCTSDRECKQALIHSFISSHPAPSWTLVAWALYMTERYEDDGSSLRALDRLQQLFPTGRFRSKQIYEQEMKRGHIELDLDKLLLFGNAGSGKTCSLAAMLGVDPPTIRHSTPVMKRPIEVVFVDVDGKKQWKKRTLDQLPGVLAEVIQSRMPRQQSVPKSTASPDQQPPHTAASQSAQPTPEKTSSSTSKAAGISTASSEEKPRATERQEEEGRLDSLLLSSAVDEGFVHLINSAPPSLLPIVRLRQMLVLDSGGQPELLEMMPVFLRGASKFVYVLKLHESLDKRATIRYFKDGKLVWEFPAYLTNEGTLRLCVRTMRSLNNKNPDIPPAKMMFLATHRDMVADEQLPGVLDTLHKRLREILLPQFREQLIYCDTKRDDFVFTLNAAKPEKEDRECAESIRECLSEVGEGGREVKVPLRWYALYQKLLEVANELGKKVLPRDTCQKVAESMEIDDESCGEALNFFDGLNMLFYFPDILPQLVFMEPQMLLDKVSELVEETYHMRQGKKGVSGEKLRFRDHGEVTEKFLGEFESHYEPPLFTAKELVTLLKGLLVFAEMSEDVYFMPCLLQVVAWEVVEEHRVSGGKALALHFPDSGPLMGTFCSTVAYLLSPENSHPCPWRVVQNEAGAPECLHRNVIKFTIPKYVGTVSLIDHFTHFELHLCTHPKKAAQLWKLAHDAVFAGLKKAGKTIGYTNNTPVPAIVCPAHLHPAKPHPAVVTDGVWACSVNSGKFGDVDEDSIPWLTLCTSTSAESATSSLSSSSPPTSQPPLSVSTAPASSTTATTTTNTPVSECSTVSSTTASVPSPSLSSPPVSSTTTNTPAIHEKKKEDDEINDRDIAVISRDHLTDWENLQPFLGLSRAQKKEISKSFPGDYGKQKRECLEVWKEERGREATYRALISAAEEARDQQLADNIRVMLEKT
jgi:GTPase SAR1 family protein